MSSRDQQDNSYQNITNNQGTTVISVAPREQFLATTPPKKTKRRGNQARKNRLPKIMNSYHDHQQPEIGQESADKEEERNSESKMRGADEETAGDLEEGGLSVPYQFLAQRSPSIFRIFFPRFTVKSITFWLSVTYVVMFVVLLVFNYSHEQTDITWNCSLYRLQNKYRPRLNINYEIWRIFISPLFHSNIAHFCLNLFALQLYGYFVQWYYQKKAYILTIFITIVFSHFFAGLLQPTTVSTTSSAITMAIVALKIYFLWQYRHYRRLMDRRGFLYMLLALIVGINLIPLFVVNNVDYSAHLGGLLVGFLLGMFFHISRIEEPTLADKCLRVGSVIVLSLTLILVIALTFALSNEDYPYLAQNIQVMCINNHT